MAITLAQIKEVQNKLNQVQIAASKINTILARIQEDIFEGITLSAVQKNSLLISYETTKTELLAAVNNLL